MKILLIGEDAMLAMLVDRLMRLALREVDLRGGSAWLTDDLDLFFEWVGEEELSAQVARLRFTSKQAAMRAGKELTINGRRVPIQGFVNGAPGGPEAAAWHKALLWAFKASSPSPAAVVIGQDTDGEHNKINGLKQALGDEQHRDKLILCATPHPEAEACFVVGFKPDDDADEARWRACEAALGFDPCQHPGRLTSTARLGQRDAKRALRLLLLGEDDHSSLHPEQAAEAARRCLGALEPLEPFLDALCLREFVREVQERLYPALQGRGSVS